MSPRRRRAPGVRHAEPHPPVEKIPPTDPAARDEGPRLIPLPDDLQPVPGTRRQLELADKLLSPERRARRKSR